MIENELNELLILTRDNNKMFNKDFIMNIIANGRK